MFNRQSIENKNYVFISDSCNFEGIKYFYIWFYKYESVIEAMHFAERRLFLIELTRPFYDHDKITTGCSVADPSIPSK